MSVIEHIGGWLPDREDDQYLSSLTSDIALLNIVGSYQEIAIDPRKALRVEAQGPLGSCQGHSISSVCEWCYILQTGEIDLQLSRAMGYYETQRLDGISGDHGSTISGGVKLVCGTGICEEHLWPYTDNRYNNKRPSDWDTVIENAKDYRIQSSYRLNSYESIRTFLGSGQGAISIGVRWSKSMSTSVLTEFKRGKGGHAIGLFALSERKDSDNMPYLWMMNSWGKRWGNEGWSEWSPNAIREMLVDRFTVAIGLSDMPGVNPREWSVTEWKEKLRVI